MILPLDRVPTSEENKGRKKLTSLDDYDVRNLVFAKALPRPVVRVAPVFADGTALEHDEEGQGDVRGDEKYVHCMQSEADFPEIRKA